MISKIILNYVKNYNVLTEIFRNNRFEELDLPIQKLFNSEMKWDIEKEIMTIPAKTIKSISELYRCLFSQLSPEKKKKKC